MGNAFGEILSKNWCLEKEYHEGNYKCEVIQK